MEKSKSRRKVDTGELIFYIAIIALPILQVLIFYFYVNFNSILLAFQTYSKTEGFHFELSKLGANFETFWFRLTQSSVLLDSFKNSVIVWFFTSIIGTFLAILFSYYIFKKWALAKTFKFFLFLPSVLPSILLVTVFKFFVNRAIPDYALEFFGKTMDPLLNSQKTLMATVLFYNVWVCFGAQILIYTGAMGQISPDVLEAGKVDGVTSTREFFSIVLPIILPTISTFMVANLATLFTNQANLYAFFGSSDNLLSKNFTIGYYLFDLITLPTNGMSEYPFASALGIICTLIAFPLTMLVRKLLVRGDDV